MFWATDDWFFKTRHDLNSGEKQLRGKYGHGKVIKLLHAAFLLQESGKNVKNGSLVMAFPKHDRKEERIQPRSAK